jgi:hypothetical protein
MRPRRMLVLAGTTIAMMAFVMLASAYLSFSIFRDDIFLREKSKQQSMVSATRTASSTDTGRPITANRYAGSHIIIVCSEFEETQKPQTRCP